MSGIQSNKKNKILSLCDGIGTGKLAFDRVFGSDNIEYYAVEIEETPRILADKNLKGAVFRPKNDLLQIQAKEMLYDWPVFDWVIFGFTCKSLSVQGKRENLEGSSGILFNCMSTLLMAKHRNPNVKFLIENVASIRKDVRNLIDKIIGVTSVKNSSSLVSAQARERLYWCNFKVRQPKDRGVLANDILDKDGVQLKAWSKSTRYKDNKTGKIHSTPCTDRTPYIEERFRSDGKANTIVTGFGGAGPSTKNIVITKDGSERPLSVRQCARLQSFPNDFCFDSVSPRKAYECLGNAWNLDTIVHILECSEATYS